ncbi:hypothetical protein GCM10029964_005110 [Kibdelosporangium lantanae]
MAERTNILTGLSKVAGWGWAAEAMYLMDRLAVYLWFHGQYADMRLGYQSLAESPDRRVAVRARSVLALLRHARGHYEQAIAEYRACATELEELGEEEALGWLYHNLAGCLIAVGSPDQSIQLVEAARALLTHDRFALGSILHTQAAALSRLGRLGEAAQVEAEALDLARATGEPRQLAMALHDRAWGFVLAKGDLDQARTLTEEAIDLLRAVGSRSALAKALRTLGAVLAGLGEREQSVRAFWEAREIARELGERPRDLSCTRAIAAAWIGEGRAAEAIPVLRTCLRTYREMGSTSATVITLHLLGAAYDSTGDAFGAAEAYAEAEKLGDPRDSNSATLLKLLLNLCRTWQSRTHPPLMCPARLPVRQAALRALAYRPFGLSQVKMITRIEQSTPAQPRPFIRPLARSRAMMPEMARAGTAKMVTRIRAHVAALIMARPNRSSAAPLTIATYERDLNVSSTSEAALFMMPLVSTPMSPSPAVTSPSSFVASSAISLAPPVSMITALPIAAIPATTARMTAVVNVPGRFGAAPVLLCPWVGVVG